MRSLLNSVFCVRYCCSDEAVVIAQEQMRKRKWDSLASGEELFGLPVTQYPGLEQTERELSMLNRLYSCAHTLSICSESCFML